MNLEEIKRIVATVQDPYDRELLETRLLSKAAITGPIFKKQVIVLIHGIRTPGEWQESLRGMLAHRTVEVIPLGYGQFPLHKFLFPCFFSSKIKNRIAREFREIKNIHSEAEITVVAHSFGTYIVSKVLEDVTDLAINRLLLCGSIIIPDYRWDKVKQRITGSILNDAGTRDVWPALAQVSSEYGPSGILGFKTAHVTDRYHQCAHSDYFTAEHIEKFWLPFLKEGQIVQNDTERRPLTWGMKFLCNFPYKFLLIFAIVIALLFFLVVT